jgi:hypothetical protein
MKKAAKSPETVQGASRIVGPTIPRLLVLGALLVAGCGKPMIVVAKPDDPRLLRKLGLSTQEWLEIQAEFRSIPNIDSLKAFQWGRSTLTDAVEVFCADVKAASPTRGPLFFFQRIDGHWRFNREEMSEWNLAWSPERRKSP